MKKKKSTLCILAVLVCVMLVSFTACGKKYSKTAEKVTMVVTKDNIGDLEKFTNLKELNLSGSTCYEEIAAYMEKHPEVKVTYTVSLGTTVVDNHTPALVLPQGSYDYDALIANLKYLPETAKLTLLATELTAQQMQTLKETYPNITVDYTIKMQGVELNSQSTGVDLSAMTPEQVPEVIEKLNLLPNITYVELTSSNGSSALSMEDVKTLQASVPHAAFHYTFELFGQKISTTDKTITFKDVKIGNSGEQTIRNALDILQGCERFILDDCGIDSTVMDGIRKDYPNTKVVWRIRVGERSWLTDTEILRAVYGVDDTNCGPLKYLTEVKYLDMGHNTDLTDLSFIAFMPNLEIAILSGSPIVNLSPLSNCQKLEFLEMAWCGWVRDISPLSSCTSLKYLNISHTRVTDVSPLDNLPIELLSFVDSGRLAGFTVDKWAAIQAKHPDWWITYDPISNASANPYGQGWRYNKDWSYTDIYKKVRDVFGYDKIDQEIENNGDKAYVKSLTTVVTKETISELEAYTGLEELDLSGSTCYDEILTYMAAHPKVKVTYTVNLGGTTVKCDAASLVLKQGQYAYETVLANLKYLPKVTRLSFPNTQLTGKQLTHLKKTFSKMTLSYTLSPITVTEKTISKLDTYPDLKAVDLSTSTCYEAILAYIESHPHVKVTYYVNLGATPVVNTSTQLVLAKGKYKYEILLENLKYLPKLTSLKFPNNDLTVEQIVSLRSAYPTVTLKCAPKPQGTELTPDIISVDLSAMTSSQVEEMGKQLQEHPNVIFVELMKKDGTSNLTLKDVTALQTAAPQITFHYSFTLFGKIVSTTDERIEYKKVSIGNRGEATLRAALKILKDCKYLLLDDCGIDYHILAGIRDDYSNTKVVWRIWVAYRSWLTDTEVLRAVYDVDDKNCGPLKYLTDVKYMDLGHNSTLTDISFISYMPKLEIAILSGSPIVDLSPLSNCQRLEFLELAWCGWVRDLSPLETCISLKYLNLGHTRVKDLSPLDNLPIEMLSFVNSGNRVKFTEADWAAVQAKHPNWWITYSPLSDEEASPYGVGWRYKENWAGYTPIYAKVREVFNYDKIDQIIHQN